MEVPKTRQQRHLHMEKSIRVAVDFSAVCSRESFAGIWVDRFLCHRYYRTDHYLSDRYGTLGIPWYAKGSQKVYHVAKEEKYQTAGNRERRGSRSVVIVW